MARKSKKLLQRVEDEIKVGIEIYEEGKKRENLKRVGTLNEINLRPFKPTEAQKTLLNKISQNEIIFVKGPAGTGKTIIALKAALDLIKSNSGYNKILITKPIVEAIEEIGFLPGGIDSKVDPYLHSFESNINKLTQYNAAKDFFENGIIKFVPLSYLRGNTFSNSIAILDEAQNTTILGLKLFLTRKDETSKLIILGDTEQSDLKLKNGENNALEDAFERFKGINGVSFMEFVDEDIVRSKILIEILRRYK